MSNLAVFVQKKKNEFLLQTGVAANLLLVPRRKATVKKFCEELVVAVGDESVTGSVPYVFHMLWDRNEPCEFAGLRVELSDTDDDIVVDRDMDSGVTAEANRVQ